MKIQKNVQLSESYELIYISVCVCLCSMHKNITLLHLLSVVIFINSECKKVGRTNIAILT
jgi:hypothetical protein